MEAMSDLFAVLAEAGIGELLSMMESLGVEKPKHLRTLDPRVEDFGQDSLTSEQRKALYGLIRKYSAEYLLECA